MSSIVNSITTPSEEDRLHAAGHLSALDFAELIAGYRTKIRRWTSDNSFADTDEWPTEDPTSPWAVYLTDRGGRFRTLAFDFDAGKGNAAQDAAAFCEDLTAYGIRHIVVASGPSDGRHVLVPVRPHAPEGLVRAMAELVKSKYSSLDPAPLRSGQGSAIRPPLSPHREGGRGELLIHPQAALRTLQEGNHPMALVPMLETAGRDVSAHRYELTPRASLSATRARLSPRVMATLRTGIKPDGDTSRSGVIRSCVVALVNESFTFEEGARVMMADWSKTADLVRAKAARRSETKGRDPLIYLRDEWDRAVKWVAANPPRHGPNEFRAVIQDVSDHAASVSWRGRTGTTDHLVLEAILTTALRVGSLSFQASHRQLAEVAKYSQKTVRRSLKRLEKAGWFTATSRERSITSFQLSPKCPNKQHTTGGCVNTGVLSGIRIRESLHDAFRWGGLPRSAAVVWAALDHVQTRTPRELMMLTGLASGTVYKRLKDLVRIGLASGDPSGFRAVHDLQVPFDQIAADLGTLGATERQHLVHERERQTYRERFGGFQRLLDPETGELTLVFTLGQAQRHADHRT